MGFEGSDCPGLSLFMGSVASISVTWANFFVNLHLERF